MKKNSPKPAKVIAEQFPLPAMPEPSLPPAVVGPQDAEMGEQLTAQYQRAVGGMRDVVMFGALMLKLQNVLSARGQNSPSRGPKAKGQGIDGWLASYAPTVSRPTAYRFMAVAEAVAAEFKLPAKVAKNLGFAGFVTTPAEELPADLQQKQLDLFEYIDGTSQRSWLDKLKPKKFKGGKQEQQGEGEQLTDQQIAEQTAQVFFRPLYLSLYKARTGKQESLLHLPYATTNPADEASLVTLLDELQLLVDQLKEVISIKTKG